jgi:tRNA threonylcarbamoyladenosine biosynthesis protein TsaB
MARRGSVNELAFDTATAACSVALRRADGEVFELRPSPARLTAKPAHTTELLPAIQELARAAEIELEAIRRVAVGVGPGAFTGLRIGVATARAITTANEIGLTPVSSLAALAVGGMTPVIDARRNEFFYRIGGQDRLAGPDQAAAEVAAAGAGAIGDGALKLRDALTALGVSVPANDYQPHVISAVAMLELAREIEPLQPDEVVPNYIRPPDAKVSSRGSWLVGGAK